MIGLETEITYTIIKAAYLFPQLFLTIENSQKMFSASTLHVMSLSILIKYLLSFAYYKNPRYIQRPYEHDFSFCSYTSAVLSLIPSSQFTHSVSLSITKSNSNDECIIIDNSATDFYFLLWKKREDVSSIRIIRRLHTYMDVILC